MGQSENPYAPTASRHKVHFPVKKTAGITLAVATALTLVVLSATAVLNRPAVPARETVNIPPTTIETIIIGTPTPAVEEEKAVLQWKGNAPYLAYEKGDTSWKANIAEDIENGLSPDFKTPDDFFMDGAIVDVKNRYVIAWGNVQGGIDGKISFRNVETGIEESAYWSKRSLVNDVLVLYDVQTAKGLKEYLVIAGETHITDLLNKAGEKTGLLTNKLPVIEIRELTSRGSIPVSYNPVTYVNGTATGVKAVRDGAGNVVLEIATRTRTNPDGGVSSVKLADILKLEKEAPIFGR